MELHKSDQPPIVILATEIIEDISELCTQMAAINRGATVHPRYIHEGPPYGNPRIHGHLPPR